MPFLTLNAMRSLCRLPPSLFSNGIMQIRFVHHHKELEEPGGFERFMGWRRSNPAKANRNTHINERYMRRLRGAKRLIMDLEEDYAERRQLDQMRPDEVRMYLLRKGKPNIFKDVAPRDWNEHQITLNTFGQAIDPYIPPETSLFSRGAKDIFPDLKAFATRKYQGIFYGLRRIRKKDGFQNFNLKDFTKLAEQVYANAYNALALRDKAKLHELITEAAFSKMWPDVEKGTLRWKLVQFNEPSKVLTVRCLDNPTKSGNDIAQIIVRMHSTQILALYDKDGHLLLGSEEEPRQCLEYVVFENHVASVDGMWRLHCRIYPNWLKPKQSPHRQGLIDEEEMEKLPKESLKISSGNQVKQSKKRSSTAG
ncbi:hypothetical protein niasHS_007152 [Heterodera schachtii]|uniref:Large ribosomal subunit protein mL45 n=1 Tax=Heterodera schachtii TaxID=97005 RepID=A0ABD2JLK3_HETSC